jgi:ribosomal protein S18 acetylase RimI-like enzyme
VREDKEMNNIVVRFATPGDLPNLRAAMVELQEHERRLAVTRLPGDQIADAYLERLQREAVEKRGAIFVVESKGVFAGFAAGWIIERDHIPETADSNRFGYLSDICVLPAFRRKHLGQRLLAAMERHFASAGITRFRLFGLAANAPARATYERAGFVPYEILYEKLVDGGSEANL